MMARFAGLALACMLMIVAALGAPAAAVSAEETAVPAELTGIGVTVEEFQLLEALNAARAEAGLPALTPEHTLVSLAGSRSDDMATRDYFSHTTPEGTNVLQMLTERGVNYQYAGETLQRNNYATEQTVDEAVRALLESAPHREILLNGRFTHIGVGHAVNGSMHYYTVIVVQYF